MKTQQPKLHQTSRGGLTAFLGAGLAAMLLMGAALPTAKADLLTYYNFNDGPTTGAATAAILTSDAPGLQTTTITTNFDTPASNVVVFAGTTINQAAGDTSTDTAALSFVSGNTNVNNGKSAQFTINTTGYVDLILSYATRGTATGFTTQTLAYSLDGTNFTDFGTATGTNVTTFAARNFDLSAINAIENQPAVTIRYTFTGATNASGNNRIDNIQLNATNTTAVPEPATVLGGILMIGAVGWSQRRRFSAFRQS